MTMTDPTALTVVDDETPGVLEPVAPVAAAEAAPSELIEPAEPLSDRLARLPERFVTERLAQACRIADDHAALHRAVSDATTAAQEALTEAISGADVDAAVVARQRLSALHELRLDLPSPILSDVDPGAMPEAVSRALSAARSAPPPSPPRTEYQRQMSTFKRLGYARIDGMSPPVLLPEDELALSAYAEAMRARDLLVGAIDVVESNAAKPGVDGFSVIAACASLVDEAAQARELLAAAVDAAAAADDERHRRGITWRGPDGRPLISD